MKVLITGSRNYTNYSKVKEEIVNSGADVIIHGDARGADTLAKEVAKQRGLKCKPYPAQWKVYGKKAGSIRNQEMLDKENLPDDPINLVIAFPLEDSIGTHDMIKRAKSAGVTVKVIDAT